MLWRPDDFGPGALDLNLPYVSALPGQDLLRDTVLDPSLAVDWKGSNILHALSINSFTVDALHLQQYMVGWSSQSLGVLSEYAPYFQSALDAFFVPTTTDTYDLIEGIVLSTIGAAAGVLSAVPNPYTQIAGALIGMGTQLYVLLAEGPQKLPPFVIPAQEYNQETDEAQFNGKVRAVLSIEDPPDAYDYTPLFMPRFQGDPVLEYRFQGNRLGVAFGFGEHGGVSRILERDCRTYQEKNKAKAECDEDVPAGESFTPAGSSALGYVPGGVRITSVIQCFPTENPSGRAPWYDSRCGGDKAVLISDVGMFYTSTNQGIQMLWNMLMKNSPQMFTLDTDRLKTAWSDYIGTALEGVVWLWNHKAKNDWGQGTWHSMIGGIASAFTTGIGGGQESPGSIGMVFPDPANCGSLSPANDPLFFEAWYEQNLYNALIKPALDTLADRQAHYLNDSFIAAYLPRPQNGYVTGAINSRRPTSLAAFDTARKAILQGYGKIAVNLDDVIDPVYRAQIEAALPKFPSFDVSAAPVGPGNPSGRLTMPPFPPTGQPPFAPPPPRLQRPGIGRLTPLQKGLAVAAVGGGAAAAAYLGRHQIADFWHRLRR